MKKILYKNIILSFLILIILAPKTTYAHALSAAFTNINFSSKQTELIYSIDSLSVIEGIGGDKNNDGMLSEQELKGITLRVEEWIDDGVVLEVNGKQQAGELKSLKLEQKADKQMLTFHFKYPSYSVGQTVKLLDGIFYEGRNFDSYNNFLAVNFKGQVSEAILNGKNREWAMLLAEPQQQQSDDQSASSDTKKQAETKETSSWFSFFKLGMLHILTGYDHLLFLIALLLRKQTFKQYAAIVTSFTIAHSITLSLAVLGWITLPSRFVEAVIAFSICYVALENIFRKEIKHRWSITFMFGLIHGLGFASILKEMAIPKSHLAVALINFNLGIEAVQLLIVLLLLPLLMFIQKKKLHGKVVQIGSIIITLLGAFWLIERIFS
ncbi:HupE/UreJ family protein [Neobacillus rhizosphaerae]|uniref:HupE/UreJ family protein n=1 Tax=Neobacillus rhizosphaerae TaxID=2880965 RepID=UPI003D2AD612